MQGSICIRLAILGRVGPETNQSLVPSQPAQPSFFPRLRMCSFSRVTGCALVRADGPTEFVS